MTPLQPTTNRAGATSADVSGASPIPPFTNKDIFTRGKHNRVLDVLNAFIALKIARGPSDKVLISKGGVTIQLAGTSAGGGTNPPGSTTQPQKYIVDSHGTGTDSDYVFAHPVGGATTKVLKPYLIRFSILIRNGVSYSAYDDVNQTRTAMASGVFLTQYITPKYIAGDEILVQARDGDGVLVDLNLDNRTFAAP